MTDRPSPHANTPPDPTADPAAWARGVLHRQVAVLEQIAEAGLRLALAIERRVTEHASDEALSSKALAKEGMAFSRVARAVRMTALLQSRLLQEMEQAASRHDYEQRAAGFRADQEAADKASQDPAWDHKARVEGIVERVARAQIEDADAVDRLVRETGERLDDDDIYGDVLRRPVGELVALICRDLGLDPDWSRLAREAWAVEEIASGVEGSPFLARDPQFTDGVVDEACPLHPFGVPLPRQRGRTPEHASP